MGFQFVIAYPIGLPTLSHQNPNTFVFGFFAFAPHGNGPPDVVGLISVHLTYTAHML